MKKVITYNEVEKYFGEIVEVTYLDITRGINISECGVIIPLMLKKALKQLLLIFATQIELWKTLKRKLLD